MTYAAKKNHMVCSDITLILLDCPEDATYTPTYIELYSLPKDSSLYVHICGNLRHRLPCLHFPFNDDFVTSNCFSLSIGYQIFLKVSYT